MLVSACAWCAASLPRTPSVSPSKLRSHHSENAANQMVEQHLCVSTMTHLTCMSHKSRDLYKSSARKLRPENVFNRESLKGSMDSGFLFAVKWMWDLRAISKLWKCIQNCLHTSQYCDKDKHLWKPYEKHTKKKKDRVASLHTGLRERLCFLLPELREKGYCRLLNHEGRRCFIFVLQKAKTRFNTWPWGGPRELSKGKWIWSTLAKKAAFSVVASCHLMPFHWERDRET